MGRAPVMTGRADLGWKFIRTISAVITGMRFRNHGVMERHRQDISCDVASEQGIVANATIPQPAPVPLERGRSKAEGEVANRSIHLGTSLIGR
jgi:hypothetical protein